MNMFDSNTDRRSLASALSMKKLSPRMPVGLAINLCGAAVLISACFD